jgi:hypothetical protein
MYMIAIISTCTIYVYDSYNPRTQPMYMIATIITCTIYVYEAKKNQHVHIRAPMRPTTRTNLPPNIPATAPKAPALLQRDMPLRGIDRNMNQPAQWSMPAYPHRPTGHMLSEGFA